MEPRILAGRGRGICRRRSWRSRRHIRPFAATAKGGARLTSDLRRHRLAAFDFAGVRTMKSALAWLAFCLILPATAFAIDRGSPADILQVRNVEITFHQAGSVL